MTWSFIGTPLFTPFPKSTPRHFDLVPRLLRYDSSRRRLLRTILRPVFHIPKIVGHDVEHKKLESVLDHFFESI